MKKFSLAAAAICAVCDTLNTWWLFEIFLSFSATLSEATPEIPVSISSKTSVPVSSTSERIVLIASIILDASPPEAILLNGFAASPGLALKLKEISSVPTDEKYFSFECSLNSTTNCDEGISRSISSFIIFSDIDVAYLCLTSDNSC